VTPTRSLRPEFVDSFPASMSPGVLYISISFCTCGHLCCCGCGQEVITPLSPAQWSFAYDGETVSMAPSIGNWALPCQSHYVIRKGNIEWSRRSSSAEIIENRSRDRRLLVAESEQPTQSTWSKIRQRLNGRRR
jgi:Family of unknown function (DUF6527)